MSPNSSGSNKDKKISSVNRWGSFHSRRMKNETQAQIDLTEMIKSQKQNYHTNILHFGTQADESFKKRSSKWRTCDCKYHNTFQMLVMVVTLFDGVIIPLILSMNVPFTETNNVLWSIGKLVDALVLADIVHNFFKPFVNEKGWLQLKISKISKKYLRSWFFVDLIAAFPLYKLVDDWEITD